MDPDHELRWPDVEALREHWQRHQDSYPRGGRLLRGTPPVHADVWAHGTPFERALVAFDGACSAPDALLREVRAPAFVQK